jgi:hypothetical protein
MTILTQRDATLTLVESRPEGMAAEHYTNRLAMVKFLVVSSEIGDGTFGSAAHEAALQAVEKSIAHAREQIKLQGGCVGLGFPIVPEPQDTSKAEYPEFRRLANFLDVEGVLDGYPIHFHEESEADNRFALSVSINNRNGRPDLLRKLATFFGCPDKDLPMEGEESFEAEDSWHGATEEDAGDLRELADEMAKEQGEGFFDCEYTAGEIRAIGNQTA